ncbi:MAG: SagB/ThcOx family dehydrogenase [Bacteroidaceae bacterium]|nr:SagB/ThcOx family dehydrogenase [Bacteroidaceae bacterium]
MKRKTLLSIVVLLCSTMGAMSQVINLPAPALSDTATLKYALENRHSTREYSAKKLNRQEIANILWAGWGYNRKDKRTAPSAIDRQEITLYVCTQEGVYMYDAENNRLETISNKNIMKLCGKQPFVETAAANIIYVCNKAVSVNAEMTGVCCGAISQNIALYCATKNIGNVVRASFDNDILRQQLKLSGDNVVVLTQSIGYPAK